MKIAVSYQENGAVYNHFGDSHTFKVYEIENNEIKGTEVIESEIVGHVPLAQLLEKHHVTFLLTGAICNGGIATLKEYGIAVCPGVEGLADEQVVLYMQGDLSPQAYTSCH